MKKNLKRIALILMVFVLSLSFVSLALAAPPDHARGGDKGTPPGLVDKGGLPPGMHGRTVDELPPGIRNNPNFREAVERLMAEEEPDFFIVGSEYIVIPEEGNKTETYKAVLRDEEGIEAEVAEVSWSLADGQAEVSINEDGELVVTASAVDSTITVLANYTTTENDEEVSYAAQLKVTLYKPTVSSIEIVGNKFVALQEDAEEPLQLEYTAIVKDQNGQVMADKEVTWPINDDWEFDFDEGTVTIAALPAQGEEITFTLTVVEDTTSVIAELEVVVYHPVFEEIVISGAAEITLPAKGEVTTEEYEAVVLDQHGQEIDETIFWSLPEGVTGVSIDDGMLIITDEAAEGSFYLWAYCEVDDFYSFEVTLVANAAEETD